MNIKMRKNIIKFNCSLALLALSQMVFAQEAEVTTDTNPDQLSYDKEVLLPYNNTITSRESTGAVIIIDVQKELERDQTLTIFGAINGKVPGIFGNSNTWGTGNAAILVDGVRQSSFYVNSMNPLEVETIVILKDATSRAMYGAQGDNGVILVSTRRGKIQKREVRVNASYGAAKARALPNYLNAADYMSRYSEAQLNDGVAVENLRYSQEEIDATRSGENPTRYPDNDFYTDDYIKEFNNTLEVFTDVRGGNENVQYYVNMGWRNNTGWLNTPDKDVTNRLNFRGNLDFKVNDIMKMSINTTSRLSFNESPNAPNIWNTAANELPNNYPIFWDPNMITDEDTRNFILSEAKLVNGQLLGGNSSFLNNVYGNLTSNGGTRSNSREFQFGLKLDIDMDFITKGLSGRIYGGMNFYNSLFSRQDQDFAVYEPVFIDPDVVDVIIHGQDREALKYHVQDNLSDFFRQESYYGTLNYNRTFGKHHVAANAVVNVDLMSLPDQIQRDMIMQTGISTNYSYANKYMAELSVMGTGSRKLEDGSRIEPSYAMGLGWVLSEEGFFPKNTFVDYLKVRTSYGSTKNDHWDKYFYYVDTFTRGGTLVYENGSSNNNETSFDTYESDISLQERRDFTFGVDANMFDRATNLQFTFFNSESLGNITAGSNIYPQLLGYEHLMRANFNSSQISGIELGLNHKFQFTSDFALTAGGTWMHIVPKITKRAEPVYKGADAALMREGTAADAMWGLKSDGLYSEAEFDYIETDPVNNPGVFDWVMKDDLGLPVPTFGAVQPGDIKYLDQNGDGLIDNLDQRIIGNAQRNQYSMYLDLEYKNFEFFVLGVASTGDSNYRSGSYFRVQGNVKYSDQANLAYGPNNKDVNAIHPRLSAGNVSNNNRNSDYWIYKNNTFTIPTMQLTYKVKSENEASWIKDARIYARATNVAVLGENTEYTEINVGGSPRTRTFSLGFVTSF